MTAAPESQVPHSYQPRPNAIAPHAAPRWVTVIGVLSIVLGAMNAWNELFNLTQQLAMLMDRGLDLLAYLTVTHAVTAAGRLVLNVLLVFAGAALLRRKPAGLTMHFALGWTMAAWVALGALAGLAQTLTLVAHAAGGRWPPVMLVGWVGRLPTVLAYPIFLIVWFAPGKHRDEFYASLAPRP